MSGTHGLSLQRSRPKLHAIIMSLRNKSERKSPSQNKKRMENGRYTPRQTSPVLDPAVPLLPHSSAFPSARNRPRRTRIDRGSWGRGSGQARACSWARQACNLLVSNSAYTATLRWVGGATSSSPATALLRVHMLSSTESTGSAEDAGGCEQRLHGNVGGTAVAARGCMGSWERRRTVCDYTSSQVFFVRHSFSGFSVGVREGRIKTSRD
jgi:hypothetical protein